uniref:C-like opsin n=1 Tax=Tripedalia cystophora TaxID=6141 RepID=A0A059NTC6_TRICY|nr:c-like opsin [Tripedalia cystophora]
MALESNISIGEVDKSTLQLCNFMGGYTSVVVVVGVIMNMCVIIGILRFFKRMDPYLMLVLSQGFCDLLSPLVAYPLSLASSFACTWLFGDGWCYYYGFVTSFAGYTSIFNLTAFAVERYVTFKFPLKRERVLSKRNMIIMISLVWIAGFVWAALPLMGISAYVKEGIGTMCSVRWHSDDSSDFYYSLSLIICAYLLPVFIILMCYKSFLGIIYSIMPRSRILGNPELQTENTSVERQQTFIVIFMVLWYNIAWLPYALVCFISVIGYPNLISLQAACIPGVFAKTSNIINPIIYCFICKQFRSTIFGKNKIAVSEKSENL